MAGRFANTPGDLHGLCTYDYYMQGPFWFVGVSGVVVSVSCFLFPLNGTNNATSVPAQSNDFSNMNEQPKRKYSSTSYTFRDIVNVASLIFSNALTYFILKTISDWQGEKLELIEDLLFFKI